MQIKSPYPYMGGKSGIANDVWERLGDVRNYTEPFVGSGAMYLLRPESHLDRSKNEVINDFDGFIPNFWRAMQSEPRTVAEYATQPVMEADLHARHLWLNKQAVHLGAMLEADPFYYDVRIAGWWVWCMSQWIADGFCTNRGPWTDVDGKLQRVANGETLHRIVRKMPNLGSRRGVFSVSPEEILPWFDDLKWRLDATSTRVLRGDWKRCLNDTNLLKFGSAAVFLDPPYAGFEEYYREDTGDAGSISDQVRSWCVEWGYNSNVRIALCGYGDEHNELLDLGWSTLEWTGPPGYTNKGNAVNRKRETVWFSPHCLKPAVNKQLSLI